MEDVYTDSLEEAMLDKMRVKPQSRPKSKDKKQYEDMEISAHGLKIQFAALLEKLGHSDTRQQAMIQIHKLISDYCNSETLRIYLSVLKGLKRTVTNSSTKEHEVLVIAYICEKYGTDLLDPIDKPPSLMKTAFRIVELLHTYFNDPSLTVQEACARALIDLYSHCLNKQSKENRLSLVFLPLTSILTSGVDRASQATAAVCISQLIAYWQTKQQLDMIGRVQRDVLFVFLKIKPQLYVIMSAVVTCLKATGVDFFDGRVVQFVNKLISFLNDNDNNATKPVAPLNAYMGKVEACRLLDMVAGIIKNDRETIGNVKPLDVLMELDKASKNKLIQVQKAAKEAMESWKNLVELDRSRAPKALASPNHSSGIKLSSLNEMRQKFKRQRSNSKQYEEQSMKNRQKMQQELKFMTDDLSQLTKGKGWGPQNRGSNFTKKGTGIGGGNVGRLETQPQKTKKSHQQNLKQLRKYVQKQRQDRKEQIGKWANLRQQAARQPRRQRSRSPNDQRVSPGRAADYSIKFNKLSEDKIETERNAQENIAEKDMSNANLTFDIKQAKKELKKKQEPHSQKDKQQEQRQKPQQKVNSQQQHSQPQQPNQPPQLVPLNKKYQLHQKNDILSKQEIEEMLRQNTLSDVSSYLGSIISQNDINQDEIQRLDSRCMEQQQEYLHIRQIKNEKRKSTIQQSTEKFLVRQNPSTNSLEFSQSKGKNMEQSVKFDLSKVAEQKKLSDRLNAPQYIEERQYQEIESQYEQSMRPQSPNIQLGTKQPKMEAPTRQPPKQPQKQVYYKNKNYQSLITRPPSRFQNQIIPSKSTSSFYPPSQSPSSIQPEEHEDVGIQKKWKEILNIVADGDMNEAFEQVFELDDSVYFLRLLIMAGCTPQKLTVHNAKKLWSTFQEAHDSRFFEILTLSLFTQANQLDLVSKSLSLEDSNFLMDRLYEMSGHLTGKLSYRSAMLYNSIQQKNHK